MSTSARKLRCSLCSSESTSSIAFLFSPVHTAMGVVNKRRSQVLIVAHHTCGKMERKRTSTQRSTATTADEVDKPREEESLRTLLKHPRTSKRARGGVLKECLQLETADQVLENLLHVNESVHSRMLEDWKQTFACFKKLWKKYRSSMSVCSVIIHLVSKLLPSVTPISNVTNSEEFILSLVHHGMVMLLLLHFTPSFFM